MLKDRIGELKATRDQARFDAERAWTRLIAPARPSHHRPLKTFARTARKRMRTENGGYRRDHLRALAQRVEVDQKELRIMGSKSVLLRTLVAASSAKTAGFGVPSSVPNWRALGESNPCLSLERAGRQPPGTTWTTPSSPVACHSPPTSGLLPDCRHSFFRFGAAN